MEEVVPELLNYANHIEKADPNDASNLPNEQELDLEVGVENATLSRGDRMRLRTLSEKAAGRSQYLITLFNKADYKWLRFG